MIIDVRCRVPTKEAGSYFNKQAQKFGLTGPSAEIGTEESYFRDLAEAGVTTGVSVSGNSPGGKVGRWDLPDREAPNEEMARLQAENPGKFIGVGGIDAGGQFHDPIAEIERCAAMGLRAIFIEPGRSPKCDLDDPQLFPIYEKCLELNLTLIPQTSGPLGAASIDYAHPRRIEVIAERYPDLRIVCGHGCYPFVREATVVAARRENVWMSPDFYLFYLGTDDWVKAVNNDFFGFQDKFLFGSGYPIVPLKGFVEQFMALPWVPEALPKILYRNAIRAFGLENDPVFTAMYPPAA